MKVYYEKNILYHVPVSNFYDLECSLGRWRGIVMTSAKIFNFTSMLTMLHEVISNGHQNFNVSYKSKMQSSQFFETKKCNIVCILQLYCIEVQSVKNILQNNSEQEWILIHFPWLVDKLYTECIVFMYVRITCNKKNEINKNRL